LNKVVIPDPGKDGDLDDERVMAFPSLVEEQVDQPFSDVLAEFASLLRSNSFSVASNGSCLRLFNLMPSTFHLFRRAFKTTLG